MTMKTAILAAVIGFTAVTGTVGANAAPLSAPAIAAEAGTTQVGGHSFHSHRRVTTFNHRAHFRRHCFDKKVRVWSDFHNAFIVKIKTVCVRKPIW
ncbi:hypothetical protein [Acuticoccus sp. I52.16.1]|uniref:hypothetical protein n=1 Tax=Acuticoccus sp. I52.16.1 TaxID=2928472 RepID=UPI001FD5EDD2|nr:hypothetical protein [Acuticoccus sp. I52.16.1]UOM33550.1 hypothetical protein MRB58_17095 [Acuticoccus sp. I52.16.1]